MKHFLAETDFGPADRAEAFALARSFKTHRYGSTPPTLNRQSWGMLFYKNSTRTRVSFEVGIHELGGHPLVLDVARTQLGRGESVEDSARVFSRYLHGMVIRAYEHERVEQFAAAADIPVINALTDKLHPCQIYSDAFTLAERWGGDTGDPLASLQGRTLAFFGDIGSNMAQSWILGAHVFGMRVVLCGPDTFRPDAAFLKEVETLQPEQDLYRFTTDPREAADAADVLYTDVFVSMGDEAEREARLAAMAPYRVTAELLETAGPDCWFMHCLPAHPGEEVDQAVVDSAQSIIFDQAENRLHMQKAILSVLAEARRSQA
ncbi:MAG: ornithine carbamoyltransferase [Opitutales bacterium]